MTEVTIRDVPREHIARHRAGYGTAFRPDVQGLRTLAVGLVVVYHLYPSKLTGGYIGVDVFLVISGYLITGLLARGLARTGRVGLLAFYARRARRLLPAATLVLTVTWLASRVLLPITQLPAAAEQIRGSALYFQNWILARDSVDYLHSDNAASPVQHYWSLSVEEQFYLLWPLIFVAAALAMRFSTARTARVIGLAFAACIVLASLWYSVHETRSNPSAAYFETTTRIWELGFGGLLALAPARLAKPLSRCGPLAWLGLAVVVACAFAIDGASAFPGSIAVIPVVATVLVLACGSANARHGPGSLLSSRPMVVIGDMSYSIYLWHWPLIVLWQAYSGPGIGVLDGPAIVIASVILAFLTKTLVEDPIRKARTIARSTRWSMATAIVTVVPVALVTVYLTSLPGTSSARPDSRHPGATALSRSVDAPSAKTPAATKPAATIPPLTQAATDYAVASNRKCMAWPDETKIKSCTFGDVKNPVLTVALIGDSHAAQWSTSLDTIAKRQHWKLVVAAHSGCPWTATMTVEPGTSEPFTACHTWGRAILDDLRTRIRPDVAVVSDRSENGVVGDNHVTAHSVAAIASGMVTYWQALIAQGISVVAIHETPEPKDNIPDCLAARFQKATSCDTPARTALAGPSPLEVAARATDVPVPVVDLNSYICRKDICPAVVGNVIVYRDKHHLTQTYTRTLTDYLERKLLDLAAFTAKR